jgi:hypothetical protein
MDHWNYRIVLDQQDHFGIRLVAYDQDNNILGVGKSLAGVTRDTRDEMLEDLDRLTQASFDSMLDWNNDLAEGIDDGTIDVYSNTKPIKDQLEWSDGKG